MKAVAWLYADKRRTVLSDNRWFAGFVDPAGVTETALYPQSAIDTLRAQLEAAEARAQAFKDADESMQQAHHEALIRAEAAEADAQRWRTWRALDEHAAAEVAWFAGGPEDRDAEIDARTKEETK